MTEAASSPASYDPNARRDTPLAAFIKDQIRRDGPMRLDTYMTLCLHHPQHGYYSTRTVLGADGDFITAPEISQTFGELIGLWCAVVWQSMGAPKRVRLIELGPGRGTLMSDALRATSRVPDFHKALDVRLVETSAVMVTRQRDTLASEPVDIGWTPHIAATISPDIPTIIVANEFFDALPVRQYVTLPSGEEQERNIVIDADGALAFTPPEAQSQVVRTQLEGLAPIIRDLAFIGTGALLAIDYGFSGPASADTLQAVRQHRHEHPLTSPGEADLTTYVDFAALAGALRANTALVPAPRMAQGAFLGTLGIIERTQQLMGANPDSANELEMATARLIAPTGMGGRFQVLGAATPNVPPLPGFVAQTS